MLASYGVVYHYNLFCDKWYPFPLTGPSKPKINIPVRPNTIIAQDQSPITLTIGDNVTALTNTRITIQCHASGVPTPTVTWTKDGQDIASGGKYTVQDDGSLLVSEAEDVDSARYTCTADSIAGKDSASSTVQTVGKYYESHSISLKAKKSS